MFCYVGNLDGRSDGLVLAKNITEAATIAGTTRYQFLQYWTRTEIPTWGPVPKTLYVRPCGSLDPWALAQEGG